MRPLETSTRAPLIHTLLNHDLLPAVQALELSSSLQIPAFQIIGLPGPEVSEARDRVKAALESIGFEFPRRRIVLNLSPSSVRKQGTGMDLAMALALFNQEHPLESSLFAWGELGLDGKVKATGMPFRALDAAFRSGSPVAFFSRDDQVGVERHPRLVEALFRSHGSCLKVFWVSHLSEVQTILDDRRKSGSWPSSALNPDPQTRAPTSRRLPGVSLPGFLQRIVGVASAGAHHLFLGGPRGSGKSLSLEWLAALRPQLQPETWLQQALTRELKGEPLQEESPPVRQVGHQVRSAALYGGIQNGRIVPGEFTLAHENLLIADEFPEWQRDSREAFREPLERGRITLSRLGKSVELPADFQLGANGNLCPCGGEFSENVKVLSLRCKCLPQDRLRYLQRISGPILDRLDLIFRVPAGTPPDDHPPLDPAEFVQKVERTRDGLIQRFGKCPGKLKGADLEQLLDHEPHVGRILDQMTFSSFRERHRALRVSLTLAAWDGASWPSSLHIHEIRMMREGLVQS